MSGAGTPEGASEANRPGVVLRAEREALGVTVREVAETLNLSLATIEAIEADDHTRLPGAVFARGYLRAYARLLDLDPAPLIAQYPEAPKVDLGGPRGAEPPIWEWIRRRPLVVLGGGGVALLLLLLLLVTAMWPGDATPVEGAAPAAGAQAQATQTGDARQLASLGSASAGESGAGIDDFDDAIEHTVAASQGSEPVGPAGLRGRRITQQGDDLLKFQFADDCWVEVRSPSGSTLYSDLNRAGADLDLIGSGPFRILLGYAPGVRLTFNGESVPLAPYTRNNVANLVLGQ